MLKPRLIPCLLIHDGGLVKTVNFSEPTYVGDPLNTVRIFNEKQVDEIIIIDIDATVKGHEPDYELISTLACECRMPLCYGGGVKTIAQVERLISLGVEKVLLSSVVHDDPEIVSRLAERVGSQSVVVCIDVKKDKKSYRMYRDNGKRAVSGDFLSFVRQIEELGAGEIVINSIDQDGMRTGYDHDLVERVYHTLSIPLSVLGGAGTYNDVSRLISQYGIIGAAAGSLFVFKGKFRAVLVQYPGLEEKKAILEKEK